MKKIPKDSILKYLGGKRYNYGYDGWPISWYIKLLRGFNTLGRNQDGSPIAGTANDPRWDRRWKGYLEQNEDVFWGACNNAVGQVREILKSHLDPSISGAEVEFSTRGRSGDRLVLDRWNDYRWNGRYSDEDFGEWDYPDLRTLYKLCLEVDGIVDRRYEMMEVEYAWARSALEECWRIDEREESRPVHDHEMYVIVNISRPISILPRPGEFYVMGEDTHTYGSRDDAVRALVELMDEYDHTPDTAVICKLPPVPIEAVECAIERLSENENAERFSPNSPGLD